MHLWVRQPPTTDYPEVLLNTWVMLKRMDGTVQLRGLLLTRYGTGAMR
ncbi:MAG: hypothetical protein KME31_25350 [Tolypothrix carrinoi HA7290-LM1]|nr:hypothetical protein [Tolypothrix carrinoi HA7290-LM1]